MHFGPVKKNFLRNKNNKINRNRTHLRFSSTFHKPLRPLRFRRQNPTGHRKPSAESPLCHSMEYWEYPDHRWPHPLVRSLRLHVTRPVDRWHDCSRSAWAHIHRSLRFVFVRSVFVFRTRRKNMLKARTLAMETVGSVSVSLTQAYLIVWLVRSHNGHHSIFGDEHSFWVADPANVQPHLNWTVQCDQSGGAGHKTLENRQKNMV